jgi:endonuclease YncB( thermonuclease family)
MRAWPTLLLLAAAPARADDPVQVDYGPYHHFLESRSKAELRARATALAAKLRGLYFTCPECDGRGEVVEIIRVKLIDPDGEEWWGEEKRWKDCPRCDREKMLFNENVASAFVDAAFGHEMRNPRAADARARWLGTLESCRVGFQKTPRLDIKVFARTGIVRGPSVPLFPLHFRLVREGRRYQWYVHDPGLHGAFDPNEGMALPMNAEVEEALAGDVLRLKGGQIIRICGIAIPGDGGKIPDAEVITPEPAAKDDVARRLLGKVVSLKADRYSAVTLEGHPIAFVELDGADVGADLLARGLARRHPKHKHERNSEYMKIESAARKSKAGCWAVLGDS